VAAETVVDDPHDRGADPVWPSSYICPELSRSSFHLYAVLNR